MSPKNFFHKYALIPVIFVPVFSLLYFILTWQGGLKMGWSKSLLPVLYGAPVVISFVVLLVIAIVRAASKKPVIIIVQIMIIELLTVFAFFLFDYKESTWNLNQYLYQDKRAAFVDRLKKDSLLSSEEKAAMDSSVAHRNFPFFIDLHGTDAQLQNQRRPVTGNYDGSDSYITVSRDCDGYLTVEFPYDNEFLGSTYAVLYAEREPMRNEITQWDRNGLPRDSVYHSIGEYTVLDTISPHWYYVRGRSPWAGMFSGGGGSGIGSGCY